MSTAEAAPAVVPETLLKKRKRDEQWAAAKSAELAAAKSRNAKNRTLIFKRAQQYQEEYEKQVSRLRMVWNGLVRGSQGTGEVCFLG